MADFLRRGSMCFAPVLLALITGCVGTGAQRLMAETIAPASTSQVSGSHEIFVATSRAAATEPGVVFSGERAQSLAFGLVEVSVPAIHETGKIERSPAPRVADPARYLAARHAQIYTSEQSARSALDERIARSSGRALIFVHGYNTDFSEAVFRMTQIVHDSGYAGTPILFTWPSSARVVDYFYDYNSATASRDALENTIRLVADAGASRIDIVAHSMGSWVTMETLRQLALKGEKDLGGRIADVVLASPDIDVDVFKNQMRSYGMPRQGFFVLTSADDRALNLSRIIAGNQPRLGGYADAEDLAEYGVTVVDVTNVASDDGIHHTKFAENPQLIQLLGQTLANDELDQYQMDQRLNDFTKSLGQTLGSAAEIIITTPFEVLNSAASGSGGLR